MLSTITHQAAIRATDKKRLEGRQTETERNRKWRIHCMHNVWLEISAFTPTECSISCTTVTTTTTFKFLPFLNQFIIIMNDGASMASASDSGKANLSCLWHMQLSRSPTWLIYIRNGFTWSVCSAPYVAWRSVRFFPSVFGRFFGVWSESF